jgi:hypothetical protein
MTERKYKRSKKGRCREIIMEFIGSAFVSSFLIGALFAASLVVAIFEAFIK